MMELSDTVKKHLQKSADGLASVFHHEMLGQLKGELLRFFGDGPIESPIEQIFFIEWHAWTWGPYFNFANFKFYTQYHDKTTGQYKIDFAIGFSDAVLLLARHSFKGDIISIKNKPPLPKLGIELDGHIWHEKTPEQVQYHKERERFLVKNGWKLLRYTGGEILRDPAKCFFEVFNTAYDLTKEYIQQLKTMKPKRDKKK